MTTLWPSFRLGVGPAAIIAALREQRRFYHRWRWQNARCLEWREANRERYNSYHREYKRRRRAR